MAITRVNTAQSISTNNGGGGSITFNGSPAQDDYVFIAGGNGSGTAGLPYGPTAALGYTQAVGSNTQTGVHFGLWYKKLGATPDTSVTFQGSGNAADSSAYIAMILRGVDLTNPLDVTPAYTLVVDGPGPITVATAGSMGLLAGAISNNVAPTAAPAGTTLWTTRTGLDTNKIGIGMAYQDNLSAGSYNTGAWTWTQTTPKRGILAAIRPAGGGGGGGPTPFEGWGIPI